ncbi:amidohydrolase family protein, partial [Eubacteriales bacterium OttesenSCG-928-K08]|nr:amidohydrolase family protein [Eubacteriales bacterium OttesenSCG-928-K08]
MEQYLCIYNEEGNAAIAQAVQAHPDRLIGFATANPWHLKRAEDILRRGLDMGLRGLKIHSRVQGFVLSSDLVKPLLRIAQEYQVPVYCHTGSFTVAEPFQLRELALEFPKVNFIMGHSGNTDFWTD